MKLTTSEIKLLQRAIDTHIVTDKEIERAQSTPLPLIELCRKLAIEQQLLEEQAFENLIR